MPSQIDEFARFCANRHTLGIASADANQYETLWNWSITETADFWRAVWDYFELTTCSTTPLAEGAAAVFPPQNLESDGMPATAWFPDVKLNYVQQVLRHTNSEAVALVGIHDDGSRTVINWRELSNQIASLAKVLKSHGVGVGDVVVGYLPDIPEAAVAFLATASLGALWSSCGQDYAPDGAISRFNQLKPTVLISATGYFWGSQWLSKSADSAAVAAALPTLQAQIIIGDTLPESSKITTQLFTEAVSHSNIELNPVAVPFNHPLWVLFSSGTTGKPKGIVHSHGGVLLEHLKCLGLHMDIKKSEKFFWHTTLSWMMWNFRVSGLLLGATVISFSGNPMYPNAHRLWELTETEELAVLGTSPGYLMSSKKAGLTPGATHNLSALRLIGSSGSALATELFSWVPQNVGSQVAVSSISGGTDVVTAFAGGSPGIPVVPGELSVRYLGVSLHSWNPQRQNIIDEVGELVITKPMPSMPIYFWDDPENSRYFDAYFNHHWADGRDPHTWRHGDWVTVTPTGAVHIHGRSDATLNRNGIRMGSADIYKVVEEIPEVAEAFVLGVDGPESAYWMPMFITLSGTENLSTTAISIIFESVKNKISTAITERLSRRHLPDEIILTPGIPHTRTGKKLEVPVTNLLAGRPVSIDPSSIDNPDLLNWYVHQGNTHNW